MSSLLHRTVSARPPLALRGDGLRLHLSDGRTILDASGGAAVACIGHGSRRVAEAMADQAGKLAYAHTGFFSTEPAEALADLLVGQRPGGLTHAFFVSSGSEAMESALKLARQYFVEKGEPQRVHYISRRLSYHGNSFGSLAAGGHPARRTIYDDVLPRNFSNVSPCFAYHFQGLDENDSEYVLRLACELEAEFQRIGSDHVIAFIAEPVMGALAGAVPAVDGYFRAMREVCDRHGALLILDEIMAGMGRTGTTHAWEQEGVTPDIQAIAKGLAGGYASIGGLLVSDRVIQALAGGTGAFVHGHTYQAHPVGCRAALEVQRIIADEGLLVQVIPSGAYLAKQLRERLRDHPFIGDIRGRGLLCGIEFVADRESKKPFPAKLQLCERLKRAALTNGLGIYPTSGGVDGHDGDNVLLAPPYNVTHSEIDQIVEALCFTLDDVFAEVPTL